MAKRVTEPLGVNSCQGGAIAPIPAALQKTMWATFMAITALADVLPVTIAQEASSLAHRTAGFVLGAQHALIKSLETNTLMIKKASHRA